MASIRGIDLFCGCGGVTHGFLRAGIDMRLGVDFEGVYRETFEKNNKVPFIERDVRRLEIGEIIGRLGGDKKAHLVVSSCAPCQPFSLKNGKRSRDAAVDPRIDLGFELTRIVRELLDEDVNCTGIFMENVPEFSKSLGRRERGTFENGILRGLQRCQLRRLRNASEPASLYCLGCAWRRIPYYASPNAW